MNQRGPYSQSSDNSIMGPANTENDELIEKMERGIKERLAALVGLVTIGLLLALILDTPAVYPVMLGLGGLELGLILLYSLWTKTGRHPLLLTYTALTTDLLVMTAVVYFLGSVEFPFDWIYAVNLAAIAVIRGTRVGLVFALLSTFLYGGLAILQLHGILPHPDIYAIGPGTEYTNPRFVLIKILSNATVFLFVTLNTGYFANVIKRKNQELDASYQALKETQAQLVAREKERAIVELAGAAAHELNQPMTVIIGYAKILLRHANPDEPHYNELCTIKRAAQKMQVIVKKIGQITHYETKPYLGPIRIVDLDKATTPRRAANSHEEEQKMIAFVLSGGGNRGALEAGALEALFAHDIQPEMVVGTSAGALNAAYIAADPSLEGARRLSNLWQQVRKEDAFPGNWLSMTWRFISGQDSLHPNDNLRRFIEAHLPPGVNRFGDVAPMRLYITGACLNTSTLYIFGNDPDALLVDAVMISAALPPQLPPIEYQGYQYLDGGVVAAVPIEVALEKGATEIYAINVGYAGEPQEDVHGIVPIIYRTITTMMHQHLLDDLEKASQAPGIVLHYIPIRAYADLPGDDFDHMAEMIAAGRKAVEEYLSHPQPADLASLRAARAIAPAPPPPGARVWVPRQRRSES